MQRAVRRVMAVIVVLGLLGWAGAAWLQHELDAPLATGGTQRFEVKAGASAAGIAHQLGKNGWLSSPRIWTWYARSTGKADQLKAGFYEIAPGETARTLLDEIVAGRVMLEQVTIIEGWTYRDLRHLLAERPGVRQTLDGVSDATLMAELGSAGVHPEGQFFPDTYRFAYGSTDIDILRVAHERLKAELEEAWHARNPVPPIESAYQALILASIVERESARPDERARIAGVYVKRLETGMRLQADPTVIYGLGEHYDGDLRTRDMRADTPYNTYTRAGLPPTPIALPGKEALRAAAQPEVTGAIFFVATGRTDGSHYFSSTLKEHNAAVKRLNALLKARERSQ